MTIASVGKIAIAWFVTASALFATGCQYSAAHTDDVLVFREGRARWTKVWSIAKPAPLGTARWMVLSNEDLSRASQGKIGRQIENADGLECLVAGVRHVETAAALNPEIYPDRMRWVLGNRPVLIGVGDQPMRRNLEGRIIKSGSFIRREDLKQPLLAVLDYGNARFGRDGQVALPRTARLYRLRQPMPLEQVEAELDAGGVPAIARLSKDAFSFKPLLDYRGR